MRRAAAAFVLLAAVIALAWMVGTSSRERRAPDLPTATVGPPPAQRAGEPVLIGSTAPAPADDDGRTALGERPAGAATTGPFLVTGLVTDASGRPQVDVAVSVERDVGTIAAGTTDRQGRFAIRGEKPGERNALVVARQGDLIASRVVFAADEPTSIDVGTLVLAGGQHVDVLVHSPCDDVPPATVVVRTQAQMGSEGVIARAETDAEGHARVGPLPAGACRILAFAPGCGRGQVDLRLPREASAPVEIEVEEARTVRVTVVDGGTNEPVADADLTFFEYARSPGRVSILPCLPAVHAPPTDEDGRTTIHDLTRSIDLVVLVSAPGRPQRTLQSRQIPHTHIPPEATEVRIELPPLRTVRWPITNEEGPIPEDGTLLTLRKGPQSRWVALPPTGRIEDGHVVVDSLLSTYIHGLAVTPDGRIARLFARNDSNVGNETSFRSARTVDVVVRYADGEPVSERWVHMRGPGNNLVGEPLALDEAGRATFDGLHGMRVTVFLSAVKTRWGGLPIGTVDLDAGSGRVEARLARPREVHLRITLDGTPGVPPGLSAATWMGMSQTTLPVETLDAKAGLVKLTWQPASPGVAARFSLTADGWVPADPSASLELEDAGSGPIERSFALVSSATLGVRVRLPPAGSANVVPQIWDEERSSWREAPVGVVQLAADGSGQVTNLRPGRYRLVAINYGAVGPAVDLIRGSRVTATLDLAQSGRASGRLIVPEGFKVEEARVWVEGRAYVSPADRAMSVRSDGTFHVLLSGTDEVVLRPEHPLLVPAPSGGTLTLTRPKDGIVLEMVEGPRVRARLEPAPPKAGRWKKPRLLAFQGSLGPAATGRVLPIELEGGELRCGSLPVGTWTLWLDVPDFAPVTLEGVEVTKEGADLRTIRLSRGSTVRFVYEVREGQDLPRATVWLQSLSEPRYLRSVNGTGAVLEVTGLGAGRFQLGGGARGPGTAPSGEIEVDGTSTVERTLGAR